MNIGRDMDNIFKIKIKSKVRKSSANDHECM
jgi:hypothetical protein